MSNFDFVDMMTQMGEEQAQESGSRTDVLPVIVSPGVHYHNPELVRTDGNLGSWTFRPFTKLQVEGDETITDPSARAEAKRIAMKAVFDECVSIAQKSDTDYKRKAYWGYKAEFFPREFLTRDGWQTPDEFPTKVQIYDTRRNLQYTYTPATEITPATTESSWVAIGWEEFTKLLTDTPDSPAIFPSNLLLKKVWVETKQIPVFGFDQNVPQTWSGYTCQAYKPDRAFDNDGNAIPFMQVSDKNGQITQLVRSNRSTEDSPVPMPKFQFWITRVVATDHAAAVAWVKSSGVGVNSQTSSPTAGNATVLAAKLKKAELTEKLRGLIADVDAWTAVCGDTALFAMNTWDGIFSAALDQMQKGTATPDTLALEWSEDLSVSAFLSAEVFSAAKVIQDEVYGTNA